MHVSGRDNTDREIGCEIQMHHNTCKRSGDNGIWREIAKHTTFLSIALALVACNAVLVASIVDWSAAKTSVELIGGLKGLGSMYRNIISSNPDRDILLARRLASQDTNASQSSNKNSEKLNFPRGASFFALALVIAAICGLFALAYCRRPCCSKETGEDEASLLIVAIRRVVSVPRVSPASNDMVIGRPVLTPGRHTPVVGATDLPAPSHPVDNVDSMTHPAATASRSSDLGIARVSATAYLVGPRSVRTEVWEAEPDAMTWTHPFGINSRSDAASSQPPRAVREQSVTWMYAVTPPRQHRN